NSAIKIVSFALAETFDPFRSHQTPDRNVVQVFDRLDQWFLSISLLLFLAQSFLPKQLLHFFRCQLTDFYLPYKYGERATIHLLSLAIAASSLWGNKSPQKKAVFQASSQWLTANRL